MVDRYTIRVCKLALLAAFVALAVIGTAFLHLCLSSFGHEEDCDSSHHCLLCAVFGCTLLGIFLSDLLASPLIIHLPVLLKAFYREIPSVLISVPVRAPPSMGF